MMYDYFYESFLWCKPLNLNGYTQQFSLYDQDFKPIDVQVYQHFLILNNEKWIDIFNLYIKRVINQQHDMLGLIMRKGNQTVTIYGDIGGLESVIRKYSIQTNFTEKYKIIHKVGLGNSSTVYKVKERFQNNYYAAKILKKVPKSDGIKIEVNILRRVDFKHLLQLQEVYETETHVILVVEYLSGGDLQEYMALHKIVDENQAKTFLKQILEALQYLHQFGIFHRDLKLENVMLRKNNQIVIADFGLADYWNMEGKYQFTRCGTPGYVAPEVLQDKQYDSRCDVYSAGILFYILVSGKQPFESENFEETVEKNYMGIINFDNLPISKNGLAYLKLLLNNDYKTRINAKDALQHEYMGYAKPKININLFKLKSKPSLDLTNRVKTHSTCESPRQLFSQRVIQQSVHSPKSPRTPISHKSSETSSPLNGLIKVRPIRRSKFQNS